MDVAIISSANGGVGSFTFNLARNLGKYVDSVDLYLYNDSSRNIPMGEFPENVNVVMTAGNPVLFFAKTIVSTPHILKHDIIHNVILSAYILLLFQLSNKFEFAVINTVHPMPVASSSERDLRSMPNEIYQKVEKRAQRIVSKKTAVTVAVSEDSKKTIQDNWDVNPEVIYHGVDENHFSPNVKGAEEIRRDLGVSKDEILFLFVGILYPKKDITTLVNAIPTIKEEHEECMFLIIGRGPEQELLRKKIREKNLTDTVTTINYVEDINKYYAAADIFIMPSFIEEFGIVYVEAMQSGLPVIAADIDVAREVVGDAGVFFTPRDPVDLADTTINLLNDTKRIDQLIENATDRARLFSWDKAAKEYVELYEQIAR